MAGNNTFLAEMSSAAAAMGDLTATYAATSTLAVPGLAIGFAAATAFAQDTSPGVPQTSATTVGLAVGGYITSAHTQHLSIDFPYGPEPVSLDVSMTFTSTHGGGGLLIGYALSELDSPSLHGLF